MDVDLALGRIRQGKGAAMRVLYEASALMAEQSGSRVYLDQLLRAMSALSNKVEAGLFVARHPGSDPARLGIHGRLPKLDYEPLTASSPFRKGVLLRPLAQGILNRTEQIVFPGRLPKGEGWDIYHVSTTEYLPLRAPRLAATVHDVIPLLAREWHTKSALGAFNSFIKRLEKQARLVIADSEWTKQDLLERTRISPDIVRVVPLAANPSLGPVDRLTREPILKHYGLNREYALFLGTLEPRKNLRRLVEAYGSLGPDPGFDLVLAGRMGWMMDGFEQSPAFRKQAGHIRLLGGILHEHVAALLSGALFFVYPSLYEGFGIPVLEAMQCGAPVIASDRASIPEVAGDAALLVDPRSVEGIADAMKRMASDESLRADLSSRGKARAAVFSWEKTARMTVECYREALA